MTFLPDKQTMDLVSKLTADPSDEAIREVIGTVKSLLPSDGSVDAEINLIANAVDPVHPGIKDHLDKEMGIS